MSRRSTLRSGRVLVGVVIASTLILGGCGKSTSGSDAPATGGDVAGAQALVKTTAGDVTWTDPGGAVDPSPYAGKTIWMITSDYSVPFIQSVVNGVKQAAAVVGMKVQVFDGKGVTQTAANGIQQAVGAGAAAIDIISVNTQYVSSAVAEANKAKIPVLGVLNTDAHQPVEQGAAAEVTIDYALSGKALVAYAVANSKDPVNAYFLTLPSIATFDAMKTGIQDGFKEYCSSACKLEIANLTEGNFKNETQSDTSSGLLRYPKTNWVFPAIDAMAQFAIPTITTAGKAKTVQLGSINAFEANLQFIVNGNVQSVDVGNSNAWLGWATVDRTLRALDGAAPSVATVPVRLFDKANLAGLDISNEDALFPGVDFRANYKKLWGIG